MTPPSALGWAQLRSSPRLGSSRLGEVVEVGFDAPLPGQGVQGLLLGLVMVGLARPRLVRASRVPSGSTMMFMTAGQR